MPSWERLTAELCDLDVKTVDVLKTKGIPLTSQLAVSLDALGDHAGKQWIDRVRRHLYAGFGQQLKERGNLSYEDLKRQEIFKEASPNVREFFKLTNPALVEIVRMCSIETGENERRFEANSRVGAVLTTNLDSLIQICDRAIHGSPRMLRTIERANKKREAGKTSLYHLHGYLIPHANAEPRMEAADRLVLTEIEYTERNDNPNNWAAITLHWVLREFPVVFVGCSMTDDLVRRALYRSRHERIADAKAESRPSRIEEAKRPKHFAVCKWLEEKYIREALKKSFSLMDLYPLWVKDYDKQLPERLKQLGDKI
jgi:hypothetical protein